MYPEVSVTANLQPSRLWGNSKVNYIPHSGISDLIVSDSLPAFVRKQKSTNNSTV